MVARADTPIVKPDTSLTTFPGPHSEAVIARDKIVMSPSLPRSYPLVIDHAQGVEVWDVDGNRYLDFMSGIAVTSTGHCHPEVVQAIKDQADKFLHICASDFYYKVIVDLAEKLDHLAPFKEDAQTFFTNSGTEAIEAAIKLARHSTGRQQFISFFGAFHGRTLGALSLTASKYLQKEGFAPLMPGVTHVPYPDPDRPVLALKDNQDYGEAVVDYIREMVLARSVSPEDVAGIFVEPILGEGGYVVPPPGFFPALRQLCDEYGILLIVDEIQSGMGRTGKWWGIQHFGVEPDILTSAKGIASGLPLGAVIARKRLMTWEPGSHGSTFGGNPVSCAAALATIHLLESGYIENARVMGQYLLDKLLLMQKKYPIMGAVRGKGLMIGIEFVQDSDTRQLDSDIRDAIINIAFRKGLLLLGAGESVIRLMPPLMIDHAVTDQSLAILEESIIAASKR
jgi:4-aminobutyrate aminotransferase